MLLHGDILILIQPHGNSIHQHLPAAAAAVAGEGQHIAVGRRLDRGDYLPLLNLGVGQRRQQQRCKQHMLHKARHACSLRCSSGAGGASPQPPWALPATYWHSPFKLPSSCQLRLQPSRRSFT
ncbi:hypothetical protein D3C72_2105940 [compost metagenome]